MSTEPNDHTSLHGMLDWSYDRSLLVRMLDDGADPNAGAGPLRETALHVATRRRRADAVALLLERGVEIDARTAGGKTAYAHAKRRGFDEVVDLLAQAGADATLTAADAVSVALFADDLDTARSIIAAEPALVGGLEPEEARMLPDLAGHPAGVELLLDAGADIAARGLDGGTPLHQSAWFGFPQTAALLISRGAPLEILCTQHELTPLGWACHGSRFSGDAAARSGEYVRIAELLLDAGASIASEGDPHGRRLLRDASDPVAGVLRRHGAKADPS